MGAVSAGFGAKRFEVEAGAEVVDADVPVVSAEVAGALSFSWGFPRFANMPLKGAVVGGADVIWVFPRLANILGVALVDGAGAFWDFPTFANILVAALVDGAGAFWDFPRFANILGAPVDGGGAFWDFPTFANMLVEGAVVEGADVPELVGLLRNEENPDPLVDPVIGAFADDCPPRLNIDFGDSFCCGVVAALLPLS